MFGNRHSQREHDINASFVPASLASCTFGINKWDHVLHIQSTDWSSTIGKGFYKKKYINETAAFWILFAFEVTKKSHSIKVWREIFPRNSSHVVE